jgi:O-antigen ligase
MSSDTIAARFAPMAGARSPKISVPLVLAFGVGALLVGIAGFSVSPKLGILALGLPIAPFFVLAPDKALLLVVATIPFDAVANIVPGGTLTRLLGIAATAGWMVNVLMLRKRVRTGVPGYLLLAFVALGGVSLAWTIDRGATSDELQTVVQLALLYLMLANLLSSEAALQRAINVWLASTAAVALIAIAQFAGAGGNARANMNLGDATTNSNYLAATLAIPVVMAVALGQGRGLFAWWRWLAVFVIGTAVFATGSRGGVVALGTGLLLLSIFRPRLGVRVIAAALLMVIGFGLAAPRTFIEKLSDRFAQAGKDRLSGRIDIWHVGGAMIADRPLLGVGFGGFEPAFNQYVSLASDIDPRWARANYQHARAPHSLYLGTAAELGGLGIGLLLGAFAAHGIGVWKVARRATRRRRSAGVPLAVLGSLVTLFTLGFNIQLLLFKPAWLALGIAQGTILAFAPRSAAGTTHSPWSLERPRIAPSSHTA